MAIKTLGAAFGTMSSLFDGGSVTGLTDAELLARFISTHDPVAFEALVTQHGPMVMSVCRGFLRDPNDVDDAFQATFLVLVKKSRTIRDRDGLGPWLYHVARRVAIRANKAAVRRRACERKAATMGGANVAAGAGLPDEHALLLHEEISRLPARLREPIILCDLERFSQARAAADLCLSERTLQRRLHHGRERLKARLIRRGFFPAGIITGGISTNEAGAAVSPTLIRATVRTAVAALNDSVAVGVVSVAAERLAREVLNSMILHKMTVSAAAVLAAGLVGWGAIAVVATRADGPTKPGLARGPFPAEVRKQDRSTEPKMRPVEGEVRVRGRVVGPDGKPIPRATVYHDPGGGYLQQVYETEACATTDADGRFTFMTPGPKWEGEVIRITAAAPGLGAGWVKIPLEDSESDLAIRLVPDDVPITGQIIDLEGKPIAGATIRVHQINAAPGENLEPWLAAARTTKDQRLFAEHKYLPEYTIAITPKVITDSDGRFRLSGIGRNRLVEAQIDGPTIMSEFVHIFAHAGDSFDAPDEQPQAEGNGRTALITYHGANFRHVAAPTKPVVGVVRDRDTKDPLAGVTILSHTMANRPDYLNQTAHTVTDQQGRYRLTGMPKGTGNKILVIPANDQPFVPISKAVPDTPGLEPVTLDFALKRGVWIEGKITDKVTGQPVSCSVEYFSSSANPNLSDYPDYRGVIRAYGGRPLTKNAAYRVVGLPGPGVVAVPQVAHYLRANERDDAEGMHQDEFMNTEPYCLGFTSNFAAIASIDAAKGNGSSKRDIKLDPGWTYRVKVVDPDGKPLIGSISVRNDFRPMKTDGFTIRASNPRKPRNFLIQHPAKGLVGFAHPPNEDGAVVTVKLEPGASITGRLIDGDRKPARNVEYRLSLRDPNGPVWAGGMLDPAKPLATDDNGRFTVTCLPTGYELEFSRVGGKYAKGKPFSVGALRSGESRQLGDFRPEE